MVKGKRKRATIYITKYALSRGIIKTIAEIDEEDGYAAVKRGYGGDYYSKRSYRLTEEEAFAEAERLRVKKLASLRNQVDRIDGMEIALVDETNAKSAGQGLGV